MNEARVQLRPLSLLRFVPRVLPLLVLASTAAFLVFFFGMRLVEGPQQVEAKALIVARNLDASIDDLASTIKVIYEDAGIGERATEIGGLDIDPITLTSDRVDVKVVISTPTIRVIGHDADASVAALYANAVAEALVEIANETGVVGDLSIVDRAEAAEAEDALGLPVEPIAILAALLVALGVLVGGFILNQPIYRLGDLAAISSSGASEEVWVSPSPPIEGKIRPLAVQMGSLGPHWRLQHCGWGEDLAGPIESLVTKQAPQLQFLNEDLSESLQDNPAWLVALLVPEGTPASVLRDAEESVGPRLGAVVLVHPRLA